MRNNEAVARLREYVTESGLTAEAFARDVLLREPRTVRRWISGENPIPQLVVQWLANPKQRPWPKRGRRATA